MVRGRERVPEELGVAAIPPLGKPGRMLLHQKQMMAEEKRQEWMLQNTKGRKVKGGSVGRALEMRRTGMGTDQLGVGKDELFGQDTVQLLWDICMEMSRR